MFATGIQAREAIPVKHNEKPTHALLNYIKTVLIPKQLGYPCNPALHQPGIKTGTGTHNIKSLLQIKIPFNTCKSGIHILYFETSGSLIGLRCIHYPKPFSMTKHLLHSMSSNLYSPIDRLRPGPPVFHQAFRVNLSSNCQQLNYTG